MLIVPYDEALFNVVHRDFGLRFQEDAEDIPENGIECVRDKKYIIFGLSNDIDSRYICVSSKKFKDLAKAITGEGFPAPEEEATWNQVYNKLYEEHYSREHPQTQLPF